MPLLSLLKFILRNYSRTPLTGLIGMTGPSGYAENPDNWIFL
jgi:hypothetical protein